MGEREIFWKNFKKLWFELGIRSEEGGVGELGMRNYELGIDASAPLKIFSQLATRNLLLPTAYCLLPL